MRLEVPYTLTKWALSILSITNHIKMFQVSLFVCVYDIKMHDSTDWKVGKIVTKNDGSNILVDCVNVLFRST